MGCGQQAGREPRLVKRQYRLKTTWALGPWSLRRCHARDCTLLYRSGLEAAEADAEAEVDASAEAEAQGEPWVDGI